MTYNRRDFVRILRDNGYYPEKKNGGGGGHLKYINEEKNDSLILQNKMNKMVCKRLIKEHGLKI